jgi:dihydrofolate reductase
MRKLVLTEYVSLDGVTQAPGHADEDDEGGFAYGGWTGPQMADHRRINSEAFPRAGAFLMGRRTYEIFARYWPTVTDASDEIALALNSRPKYVASRTLREATWQGTTIIRDVPRAIVDLKKEPGRPILVAGSSGLAQSLIELDLVDTFELWLHPVLLGSGKRLFREGSARADLQLVESRTTPGGLVILTYERDRVAARPE